MGVFGSGQADFDGGAFFGQGGQKGSGGSSVSAGLAGDG